MRFGYRSVLDIGIKGELEVNLYLFIFRELSDTVLVIGRAKTLTETIPMERTEAWITESSREQHIGKLPSTRFVLL